MFTKTILLKEPKHFQIGDFMIAARIKNTDFINEPVNIPGSFMAFEKNFSGEADFNYIVDENVEISRGRQIYESENFMRYSLYECGDDVWEWVHPESVDSSKLDFKIKKDFSEIILKSGKDSGIHLMMDLGYMFAYAMLQRNAGVLHGIIMEYENRGILLLARSGVGKSTHSHLWRDEERALIINGDRCLCRNIGGTWYAYGMPWCGNSGEYINRKVPITNIVFLDRGEKNLVKRLDPFTSTIRLMESVKAPTWDQELYTKALDFCDRLVEDIPVWNLFCTPDVESVKVLKKALFEEEN